MNKHLFRRRKTKKRIENKWVEFVQLSIPYIVSVSYKKSGWLLVKFVIKSVEICYDLHENSSAKQTKSSHFPPIEFNIVIDIYVVHIVNIVDSFAENTHRVQRISLSHFIYMQHNISLFMKYKTYLTLSVIECHCARFILLIQQKAVTWKHFPTVFHHHNFSKNV